MWTKSFLVFPEVPRSVWDGHASAALGLTAAVQLRGCAGIFCSYLHFIPHLTWLEMGVQDSTSSYRELPVAELFWYLGAGWNLRGEMSQRMYRIMTVTFLFARDKRETVIAASIAALLWWEPWGSSSKSVQCSTEGCSGAWCCFVPGAAVPGWWFGTAQWCLSAFYICRSLK